jgi:ubiquinone/menaquinone biosynthesis C-methylase UbiE
MEKTNLINNERNRIQTVYKRRSVEVHEDIYAPWQPGEMLMTSERKRIAASMLRRLDKFPKSDSRCLEIGYGKLGWLADLLSWKLNENDLYGMELDQERARKAQSALPAAHLQVGDATELPWPENFFDIAIVSTVFSSILDSSVKSLVASETNRVVAPGGVVILYDLAVNNPRNKDLRAVTRHDVKLLFPTFDHYFKSLTLAPPIARTVAERSWVLAVVLSSLPLLRTHLMAVMVKR